MTFMDLYITPLEMALEPVQVPLPPDEGLATEPQGPYSPDPHGFSAN